MDDVVVTLKRVGEVDELRRVAVAEFEFFDICLTWEETVESSPQTAFARRDGSFPLGVAKGAGFDTVVTFATVT